MLASFRRFLRVVLHHPRQHMLNEVMRHMVVGIERLFQKIKIKHIHSFHLYP